MAWTTPRTWVALETVTASHMNTHLRDNFLETAVAKVTTAGDIVYATGANALARLGVGDPYEILRVNAAGSAPEWVSSGVLVQRLLSSTINFNVAPGSTTYADITNASVAITPLVSGSRLVAYLTVEGAGGSGVKIYRNIAGSEVRVVIGLHDSVPGAIVQELPFSLTGDASNLGWLLNSPVSAFRFDNYMRAANGARTLKLQYDCLPDTNLDIAQCKLVVEEWTV